MPMRKGLLSVWTLEGRESGVGNAKLLDQPLTAFFASRQCPGTAIRAAMTWAVEQARSKSPIISGFHSPLEQSVLEVLLTAGAPCVIVIARRLEQACFPSPWLRAVREGTAAVVSMENSTQRLTTDLAVRRNGWIANHAAKIVIAHASAEGNLVQQAIPWGRGGRDINYLS